MDTGKLTDTLKILANVHRANIMRHLHEHGKSGFVEMMEQMGLDPKGDCGTFGYHLSELQKAGVLKHDKKGLYTLTEFGDKIWLAMQQIDIQVGDNIPFQKEEKISIKKFREQDIPDFVEWMHEEKGEDAPSAMVEAVTRHNYFVDGPFDFLPPNLRVHSILARSIPGGEILGFMRGFTMFNPDFPGTPRYGEKRLLLSLREPALAKNCDKELVFSLLFKEMVKIANENRYHIMYESWIEVNEKEHELKTFKDLGLRTMVWPKSRRVTYQTPDWLKEHTLGKLKTEGFDAKLLDLLEPGKPISYSSIRSRGKKANLQEQIEKLKERGIITEEENSLRLADKYQIS